MKEEKLEVAGGKCWRGKWLSALCFTGEVSNSFPLKVKFETVKVKESAREYIVSRNLNISQRLGSCLLPYFLLWWPIQSSPLPSTIMMIDFILFVALISNDTNTTSRKASPQMKHRCDANNN